jgi:tripartite ATP-independent transporter DctM subunit
MLALFLISLFGFVLLSVPIAFALVLTSLVLATFMNQVSAPLLIQNIVRGIDSFPLMAIPFFLLAGEIMNTGGISRRIVQVARALMGHIKGGLGYVNVLASMLFAGVSGSAVADTAAIGSMLIPIMVEEGCDMDQSAAITIASSVIGPIIPPSIPMIIFGVIGNVSIVRLFLGGIVPGVLIGLGLMLGWYFHARKRNYRADGTFSIVAVLRAMLDAIWALVLPGIILGGIIFGVFTPTEAAVIAVVYAFLVSFFIYKDLKLADMPRLFVATARNTAIVMLVCGAALAAGYYITTAQIPALLADTLLTLAGDNKFILMLVINILLLLVGCVLDLTPALLIMGPMLLPIITKFGIDPVYFGCVMVVNLCIGLITPPVGNVLYVGCSISKLTVMQLSKAVMPYILIMIAVLIFITYVPGTITFIPSLLK